MATVRDEFGNVIREYYETGRRNPNYARVENAHKRRVEMLEAQSEARRLCDHQDKATLLRDPNLHVESGVCVNLTRVSALTTCQLDAILSAVCACSGFRPFGGRFNWDHKFAGEASFELPPQYECCAPIVHVLIEMARKSLPDGQDIALLQLIVNCLQGKLSSVKPHSHRCQQLCVSLGPACTVEVEGKAVVMEHGDCLPLSGEIHGVPKDKSRTEPRVSICLFYGSALEYAEQTIGVNADGGLHFVHPLDHPSLDEARQLGEFSGTIKYISEAFGYGIIECQALKDRDYDDVFFKKKAFLGRPGLLAMDSFVEFSAFVNNKGNPQLKEILVGT